MPTPRESDLAIEIGKAQATALAAQEALERVEHHLSDRMDRLETRVDKGFEDLDDKFDRGIGEIKTLLNNHHEEITTIKIKSSHEEGVTKHKNESRSTTIAVWAVLIAFLSALLNVFGPVIAKHL